MSEDNNSARLATRFRGFLPVVVDVETAGFNPKRDALLEIAAVLLDYDERNPITLSSTQQLSNGWEFLPPRKAQSVRFANILFVA